MDHIRRKHPADLKGSTLCSDASSPVQPVTQPTKQKSLSQFFQQPLPRNSSRARDISNAILQFIVKDLHPFSTVENEGFKNLIQL